MTPEVRGEEHEMGLGDFGEDERQFKEGDIVRAAGKDGKWEIVGTNQENKKFKLLPAEKIQMGKAQEIRMIEALGYELERAEE